MGLLNRTKKDTAPAKGRPAAKSAKAKPPRGARVKQMRQVFAVTKQSDPRLVPYLLIAFFTPFMLLLALGLLLGQALFLGLLGFMLGLLAAVLVFGKRVQATAYAGVEGQPGAAAAVLQNMRGDWRVTPAAGFNREQEMVHRVLGRPGVILVAEGVPGGAHRGTKNLIANEKKRVTKVIGETPVYDVLVGDEEGMVPLRGLERHLLRMPRNIKPKQVNVLDVRLKALGTAALPIPKGPMPKGGRIPRGKVR